MLRMKIEYKGNYMHRTRAVFKILSSVILFIFLFSACSSLPKMYFEQLQLTSDERVVFNQKVFDAAWMKVNRKYFDPTFNGKDWVKLGDKYRAEAIFAADTDQLYAVINKLLGELGVSHLIAVRTARKDITSSSKKKGAIGIMLGFLDDKACISAVFPNSPASKAGVQKGWLVAGRDGKKYSKGNNEFFYTIAGEPVTFDFLDQYNQLHSLRMIPVRQNKLQFVEARELDNGFLYLRLDTFNRRSVKLLRKKLEEHISTKGVILDLRTNPGGNSFYCQVAAGQFFPDTVEMGNNVTRKGREREEKSVDFLTLDFDKPMVVLTSSRSASAAEIFSHILQFHHRAAIVGQKTAGAVLSARKYRLPDGGEIMVPVSDYIGLNGERLEGAGVTPDREVPAATLAEIRAGKDRDIEIALEILSNN